MWPRIVRAEWRRPALATLTLGLALLVAACGPAGVTTKPTPTVAPTVTPTPVPCATWRIVPSLNQTQYASSTLNAVGAVSPSAAWAVGGSTTDGIAEKSLIEQWDGSAWRIISNPSTISFSSVVIVSSHDVWAVGYNRTPRQTGHVSQFEHWNGTQWSIVPSPTSNQPNNFVLSMAAIAANDVWAVGKDLSSDIGLPLIERWNGASWQVVTNPTLPGVSDSALDSVARIPGTAQLWATGYVLKGPRPAYNQPLIERWDGSAWQVIATPALPSGAFGGELRGVVSLSPTDAWAVGDYTASNHTIRTLIMHWNGTAWQVAASPDTWGSLASVAAAGAHDVRAVGHIAIKDGNDQHALIEQWDGASWHMLRSPEPGVVSLSDLASITTDGAGNYWAVGSSYSTPDSGDRTLTLHCP
jgi:hypothetical protein